MKNKLLLNTVVVQIFLLCTLSCNRYKDYMIDPSVLETDIVSTASSSDIRNVRAWYESMTFENKGRSGLAEFIPKWSKEIKQINTVKGKMLLIPVDFGRVFISQRGRNNYWHRLIVQLTSTGGVSGGRILSVAQDYSLNSGSSLEKIITQFENGQVIKNFSGYIKNVTLDNQPISIYQYVGGIAQLSNCKLMAASGRDKAVPNARMSASCYEWYWVTTYSDGSQDWEYLYTTCEQDGEPGGGGGDSSDPPASQGPEPKVGLNEKNQECNTVKKMWNASLGTNPDGSKYPLVERAALITDRGLLVMPTSGNRAEGHLENGKMVFTPTGDQVSNSANLSYFDLLGGFVTDPNTGELLYRTYEGETYKVLGNIHTHPWTSIGNPQLPSSADRGDQQCRTHGISMYIMGAEGITEYNNSGSLGVRWNSAQISGCNGSIF